MTRTAVRAAIAATALLSVSLLGGGTAGAAAGNAPAGAAPAYSWVVVPDVRWRTQSDAVAELTLLGFSIRSEHEYTTVVCTLPLPAPTVIEQFPSAGSTVIRGAGITLGITDYKLLKNEC